MKWANRNWTRFYKELLSQSFEVLQMWLRHTQPPVYQIAIVSMVSMLFPLHLSGIIWHPGGMLWNAMEFHGIQKLAIVYMVSMVFPWHFSEILWNPGGIPWDAEDCHSFYGFYAISMAFQWKSGIQVECCGMPWNSMGYRR